MPESYPKINGYHYSYGSIELVVDGRRYVGHRTINYNQAREVGVADGSPSEPLAFTRGHLSAGEGELALLRQTFNAMVSDLGAGWFEKQFDINVTFADKDQPTVTDELRGCVWTDRQHNNEKGPDATVVTLPFRFLKLLDNGVEPVEFPLGG